MRKFLLLTALVIATLQVTAANVDLKTAQQSAQRFLMSKTVNGRFMASAPTVKWTHEAKTSSNAAQAAYYIVNTDRGYVIVSGDDRAKEILAYGEGSLSSINDLPEAMQYFLDIYQKQMEYLQAHPKEAVQKFANNRGFSVDPLLKTTWAQGPPYNMRCPKVGRDYCKVGCTAVALAQVMKYWEYPTTAPAMEAYTSPKTGITASALPEYTFDWANMRDTYEGMSSSAIDQMADSLVDAIGYLMRYVGQAERVDYAVNQTGTQNMGILGAIQLFGFDEGARLVKKCDSPDDEDELHAGEYTEEEYYNDEQWGEAIQAELRAGRPLVYCAYDMSADSLSLLGHAFNVDGYNADDETYHVNFGMSSDKNGWFAIQAFQLDHVTTYDFWPIFFAGVQPPGMTTEPRILVSPQELSMESYVGETATATFNVVGERLSGDITVALDDANGVFAVDATTIAVEDSAANVNVTVTYAPQAVGTHNATITLSSDGVESKVVTLTGVATNAPLVVYDPVMLPADSAYINLTSFRADWTDSTAVDNVLSYTLEVNEKPAAPTGLLTGVDWSDLPKMNGNQASHASDYLPEGWGYSGYDFYLDGSCVEIGTEDVIMTKPLDLSGVDKVTVVFRGKNYYDWKNSPVKISTSIDSEEFELATDFADYTVVLDCGDMERIRIEATDGMIHIQSIQVYAGDMTAPQLRANVTGDATHKVITGITDKFFTVTDLNAEGTYLYKVKALYSDGTESEWSNTEMVTLFENTPAYKKGDLNHDGIIDVVDVTMLISLVLNEAEATFESDMDDNGILDVVDVTMVISLALSE